MRNWYEIYKRNIYGVIGTLVFHILLFLTFLLADVDIKGNVREEPVVIEFPDLLPEPELPEEEQSANEMEQTESAPVETNRQSNIASNQLATENTTASQDEFFDNEYLQELEAAKQLRSSVSDNLSKEVTDISDIEMPVETTEGMDRDSIKNVIYVGESNISYYLSDPNRYHESLPVPVYLAQGGGTVIVDIEVDRSGKVISAKARGNNTIRDKQIFLYAEEAASRTRFNTENNAPSPQKGTIHYTFVAQ